MMDGERVICLVDGEPDGKVIAFDKLTGKEMWRALSSDWEPGYAPPIIFEIGGVRQLVICTRAEETRRRPRTGSTCVRKAGASSSRSPKVRKDLRPRT